MNWTFIPDSHLALCRFNAPDSDYIIVPEIFVLCGHFVLCQLGVIPDLSGFYQQLRR